MQEHEKQDFWSMKLQFSMFLKYELQQQLQNENGKFGKKHAEKVF